MQLIELAAAQLLLFLVPASGLSSNSFVRQGGLELDRGVDVLANASLVGDSESKCGVRESREIMVKQTMHSDGKGGICYYANLFVGGQPIWAILDTGSFESVIFTACAENSTHKNCCRKEKCSQAVYQPDKSPCFHWTDITKSTLSYGSGDVMALKGRESYEIRGHQGNVEVRIAKLEVPQRVATDTNIGFINYADGPNGEYEIDAIFGIGFESSQVGGLLYNLGVKAYTQCYQTDGNKDGVIYWNHQVPKNDKNWMRINSVGTHFYAMTTTNWKFSHPADYHVAAVQKSRKESQEKTQIGTLEWIIRWIMDTLCRWFGWFCEEDTYTFAPKTEDAEQDEDVDTVVLNYVGCNPDNGPQEKIGCGAIIDSGTSLLTLPSQVVDGLFKSLSARGHLDCDDFSQWPDLEFTLKEHFDSEEEVHLSLPPQAYVTRDRMKHKITDKQPNGLHLVRLPLTKADREEHEKAKRAGHEVAVNTCSFLLQPDSSGTISSIGPMLIIGMPLMRKYAVHFNSGVDYVDKSKTQPWVGLVETNEDCSSYTDKFGSDREGNPNQIKLERSKRYQGMTMTHRDLNTVDLEHVRLPRLMLEQVRKEKLKQAQGKKGEQELLEV